MNVKYNTLIVYFSRIYTAILGIMIIPQLLVHLGTSQFGLIGIFAVIQACLQILDAGIGGVLTRESIKSRSNIDSFSNFTFVFYRIVCFFLIISLLVILFGWFFSSNYAMEFLNTTLDRRIVVYSVFSMFIIFAMKYMQGPFRSVLLSYERHITLSIIDVIGVTISNPIALLLIVYFNGNIITYFILQIISSLICGILLYIYYKIYSNKIKLTLSNSGEVNSFEIKKIIQFAFQLSILSILWIIVNQSDKLALIKVMQLKDYAVYGIALSLLALLNIFTSTMIQIVRPRLTKLYNDRNYKDYIVNFRDAFGYLSCILIPLTIFMFYFGKDLVLVWTNDFNISIEVMKYLPFLFCGALFSALSEFCFLLLYSHGNIKNHTIFYTVISFIIIPLNIYVAATYLGSGSAILYMIFNLMVFFSWSLININKYIIKGGVFIINVIISFSLISLLSFYLFSMIDIPEGRGYLFTYIFLYGVCVVGICTIIFKFVLTKINMKYRGV